MSRPGACAMVAVALVTVTSCAREVAGSGVAGPSLGGPAAASPDAAPPDAAPPASQPLPAGLRFDPCAVISWDDLPAQVRGERPPPSVDTGEPGDPIDAGCKWENTTFQLPVPGLPDEKAPPRTGVRGIFNFNVFWGPSLKLEQGGPTRDVTFGGRPGQIRPSVPADDPAADQDDEMRTCSATLPVPDGVVGVALTQNRFDVDECTIVADVATAIAGRIP